MYYIYGFFCVNQVWSIFQISGHENNLVESLILQNIRQCKVKLKNVIEPNFGLIEHLSSLNVLDSSEAETVRSKQTTTSRNEQILEYMLNKRWTDGVAFMIALMVNCQQHVVNYILGKSG
jgi:hypothetical protein